jgi:hypothetical protein
VVIAGKVKSQPTRPAGGFRVHRASVDVHPPFIGLNVDERQVVVGHGPDKITYGSICLAVRNRRSVRLNGRTSGPGWRVELFGVSPWVEVRLPRELG